MDMSVSPGKFDVPTKIGNYLREAYDGSSFQITYILKVAEKHFIHFPGRIAIPARNSFNMIGQIGGLSKPCLVNPKIGPTLLVATVLVFGVKEYQCIGVQQVDKRSRLSVEEIFVQSMNEISRRRFAKICQLLPCDPNKECSKNST